MRTRHSLSDILQTCIFRLVLKIGKAVPKLSKLEFLEKFLPNNFALSDAEGNTSGLLNRGNTADLSLLRALLANSPKNR